MSQLVEAFAKHMDALLWEDVDSTLEELYDNLWEEIQPLFFHPTKGAASPDQLRRRFVRIANHCMLLNERSLEPEDAPS